MKTLPSTRVYFTLVLLLGAVLLFVYSPGYRHGFNIMQTASVSYESESSLESLEKMRKTGANSVAFVVFLKQKNTSSNEIESSWDRQYKALRKSIAWARQLGFEVGLKPQMLVEGSWSGAIKPLNWAQWFAGYTGYIYELAVLAQAESVDFLVIGTELRQSTGLSYWADLIDRVRSVYKGELTYTAHGIDGLTSFRFWNMLDSASVSLYPALGNSSEESRNIIRNTAAQLAAAAENLPVPVWVAEVGIASRKGARQKPWAWQNLSAAEMEVDMAIQGEVLSMWLDELNSRAYGRVLVWNWYTDPAAGGDSDGGYTVQNKPAEKIISCKWSRKCA